MPILAKLRTETAPNGNTSRPSAEYPASSPYVVAVGGTTLTTNSALGYSSESAWPYSGGGVSSSQAKPSWQNNLSGSYRQVPDLAFDADWTNSPTILYYNGAMYYNGGTSLASPLFVGAWAVLESANNNALGFAPPPIYPSASQLYASSTLHDVTTGNNGHYLAGTGYDNATGLGSFDITKMLAFFAASSPTYTVTISASTSGGSVSPSGSFSVSSGATKTFTITPNSGHSIASINSSCGYSTSGNGPSYTITTNPITANCTITVAFTQ